MRCSDGEGIEWLILAEHPPSLRSQSFNCFCSRVKMRETFSLWATESSKARKRFRACVHAQSAHAHAHPNFDPRTRQVESN